ncbi:hypothetical protein [Pseudomonas sp. H2_H03]
MDRLPRSRPLTAQGLALAELAAGMGDSGHAGDAPVARGLH